MYPPHRRLRKSVKQQCLGGGSFLKLNNNIDRSVKCGGREFQVAGQAFVETTSANRDYTHRPFITSQQ